MTPAPAIIGTWHFGLNACRAAWPGLAAGGSSLDAVEAAGNQCETDLSVNSVGRGGLPNRLGEVELDAAIMQGTGHRAGCVVALRGFARPISIARRVMEASGHTMLAAAGAEQFALEEGFTQENLLSDSSRERWNAWRCSDSRHGLSTDTPHDTLGVCAIDHTGELAAGCTTSGMAWKRSGRVGDSAIIGSGLYVEAGAGAACGTGHGDQMMRACLSYRAVAAMARGLSAQQACIEALQYLMRHIEPAANGNYNAALIALRADGDYGSAATASGFAGSTPWQWAAARGAAELQLFDGIYIGPDGAKARPS